MIQHLDEFQGFYNFMVTALGHSVKWPSYNTETSIGFVWRFLSERIWRWWLCEDSLLQDVHAVNYSCVSIFCWQETITFVLQVLGFNLMESGLFSVLPWLTMAISANLGGWIADTLVSRGVSVTLVRKVYISSQFYYIYWSQYILNKSLIVALLSVHKHRITALNYVYSCDSCRFVVLII
jgi:hypothetical protein